MNGVWPVDGCASALAQAVSTGPPRAPSTVLTCAESAPSPAKPSPICVLADAADDRFTEPTASRVMACARPHRLGAPVADELQELRAVGVGPRVVAEQRDDARDRAFD